MFSNIGFGEIAVIVLVALLIFGPTKLPELLQGLGKGMREFQKAMRDVENEVKESIESEINKKNDPSNKS